MIAIELQMKHSGGQNLHGRRNTKGHPEVAFRKNVRRRSTLPRSHPRSTIDAEGLSFRVRNGTGRFPFAMTAETLLRFQLVFS
jgi:hypothetical protein